MVVLDTIRGIWNGYDDETRRRELSHWRGVGKWSDDAKWLGVGRESRKRLEAYLRMLARPPLTSGRRSYLEWGPGGGSNALAFSELADRYFGVDISQKNLDEAQRVVSEDGEGNFRPILLEGEPPNVKDLIDCPIDVFLSTAVFQHFPSGSYGISVLQTIRSLCSDHAIGLIQIRYDDGHPKFTPISSEEEYNKKFITATSYRLESFAAACRDCGFKLDYIGQINPDTHYATYYIRVH